MRSITLQNLISLYPEICGMTGTAATQADEFHSIYALEVEVIPPNRPNIRVDLPDRIFADQARQRCKLLQPKCGASTRLASLCW